MLASLVPGQSHALLIMTLWLAEKVGISKGRFQALFIHSKIFWTLNRGENGTETSSERFWKIQKLFRNENHPSETASNSRMKNQIEQKFVVRNYRKFGYSAQMTLNRGEMVLKRLQEGSGKSENCSEMRTTHPKLTAIPGWSANGAEILGKKISKIWL